MHPILTEYTNSILVCVGYVLLECPVGMLSLCRMLLKCRHLLDYEPSQNNHTVYAVYIYSLSYKFLFLLRNERVKLSGRHKRILTEKRQSF